MKNMLTGRLSKYIIALTSRFLERTVHTALPIKPLRDPQIRSLCHDHFADLIVVPVSEDDPRPQKRARLFTPAKEGSTISARVYIINDISILLGIQESTELTGLSRIAVYVMAHRTI
jgi:hypothetical protein